MDLQYLNYAVLLFHFLSEPNIGIFGPTPDTNADIPKSEPRGGVGVPDWRCPAGPP